MTTEYRIGPWTIQASTQTITARQNGRTWQQDRAYPAICAGRNYFLAEFDPAFWGKRHNPPYAVHCWLLLDEGGKVLAVGASQHDVIRNVH